ncbi:MAG: glycosyltransferase family 4 protein [Planctomycetaceae bacterium]
MSAQVVFCTHDSPTSIGGPFTWIRRLLPQLREAGIDSRVLALTHYGGTGTVVEALRQDGFEVAVTDCPERTEDGVRWILSQLNDPIPRVFVPNLVVPALFAARWLRQAGCTTVGVLHSDDDYYRAIQREFVRTSSPFQLTNIVTVSEQLQNEVLQRSLRETPHASYIPYGVQIPNHRQPATGNGLKIAYVGRLAEEQKRISLVAKAFVAACERIPGTEAVLFGDGPDRQNVERVLATQTAGHPVTAAGPLRQEDVQARLLSFDVIVLLSDYEGLPISLLEAMACGCVPLCRQMKSGIPQLVSHEQTGLIVSDDTSDFVSAVRRLADDQSLRQRLRSAARDVVVRKFSDQHSVNRWCSLLTECITNAKTHPLRIPRRIKLPPARPELEGPGARAPGDSALQRRLRRLRIKLGALRRRLFFQ